MSTDDDRFASLNLGDAEEETPETPETPDVEAQATQEEPSNVQQGQGKGQEKAGEKPKKTVLDDLKAERAKRQAKEEELRILAEKLARYETQEQAKARENQPVKKDLSFDEDPLGYLHEQTRILSETNKQLQEKAAQYEQQEQQRAQLSQLQYHISRSVENFTKETPDFANALTHVRTVELTKMRPFIDAGRISEEQAIQMILQNELQAAATIIGQGADPAEVFYNYAKAYGYQPAVEPGDDDDEIQQPELKPDPKAAQNVQKLTNGQKYTRNKGTATSKPTGSPQSDDVMKELFGI